MQFGSVNAIGVGVVAAALFTFTAAPVARAAETVAAGETLAFTEAEGGVRVCRIADTIIPELAVLGCGDLGTVWRGLLPVPAVIPNPFDVILTRFDASANEAEAAFQNTLGLVPGQFGLPYYSSAAVYNDFTIDDPLGIGNVVDAQFEIKFSWEGGIAGTGNYDGRITLSVEVEDISAGEGDPVGIGSFDLAGRDRQGDQGFTDIAAGGSAYNRNNDTAAFSLKLRSGGTYRIWFKAEAYGAPLLATLVESTIRGRWSELLVTIDEDSGALLTQIRNDLLQHDMDIKNDLAQHDTDIKADIATHDADIKALLAGLGADLAEIKRLLNTPTGRRPDFPIQE